MGDRKTGLAATAPLEPPESASLHVTFVGSGTSDDGFQGVVPVAGNGGSGLTCGDPSQPAQAIDGGLDHDALEPEALGKLIGGGRAVFGHNGFNLLDGGQFFSAKVVHGVSPPNPVMFSRPFISWFIEFQNKAFFSFQ